jgi:hypothetical protein
VTDANPCFAYFITPHGFGHATRAAAVMGAVQRLAPGVRFEIFTRAPRWLFEQSLTGPFGYHAEVTDVGLAQHDSLHEDLAATVHRLDELLPFRPERVAALARHVADLGCQRVLCDIAPLGIAVARAAGVPSVLIENFTWDWIYEGYTQDDSDVARRLAAHAQALREVFHSADQHIQTEPVCEYVPCDLVSAPVSRPPRQPAAEVRATLGVSPEARLVLITMGGLSLNDQHLFLDQLAAHPAITFILPGHAVGADGPPNLIALPDHGALYHPDLMDAADAVVGKTGYSTVAEAYHAGLPFGYVSRPRFRESDVMAAFIQAHMGGIEWSEDVFRSGAWLAQLPDLLALGRSTPSGANGAEQIARFLLKG